MRQSDLFFLSSFPLSTNEKNNNKKTYTYTHTETFQLRSFCLMFPNEKKKTKEYMHIFMAIEYTRSQSRMKDQKASRLLSRFHVSKTKHQFFFSLSLCVCFFFFFFLRSMFHFTLLLQANKLCACVCVCLDENLFVHLCVFVKRWLLDEKNKQNPM